VVPWLKPGLPNRAGTALVIIIGAGRDGLCGVSFRNVMYILQTRYICLINVLYALRSNFNVLLPLLEANMFMDGAVARLLREGYRDDDPESVLALLVFALGQLAIEGVTGYPTRASHDESSGFRGGSIERPSGLGLFNEARRRIGMVSTQPCLETVQIMLLQATYFEASARHLDFWTSTSAASLACTCLIKSQQIDWTSSYGDLVKRAYWVCVLHER
jgi:hypothetical protein